MADGNSAGAALATSIASLVVSVCGVILLWYYSLQTRRQADSAKDQAVQAGRQADAAEKQAAEAKRQADAATRQADLAEAQPRVLMQRSAQASVAERADLLADLGRAMDEGIPRMHVDAARTDKPPPGNLPEGVYLRRWCEELSALLDKCQAHDGVLEEFVRLYGRDLADMWRSKHFQTRYEVLGDPKRRKAFETAARQARNAYAGG